MKRRANLDCLIEGRDKLSHIRGKRIGGEPASEHEHFYLRNLWTSCGQAVDKRLLSAVLHHEQPDHKPLPTH